MAGGSDSNNTTQPPAGNADAPAVKFDGPAPKSSVTPEFKEASTRAAIRGLRGLEQTAIMLETYAPELYPETNEVNGVVQKHFGRIMMESAAQAIRDAWLGAIVEIEHFPSEPANLIESHGRLRQALFEIAVELARPRGDPRFAADIAREALKTNLLPATAVGDRDYAAAGTERA